MPVSSDQRWQKNIIGKGTRVRGSSCTIQHTAECVRYNIQAYFHPCSICLADHATNNCTPGCCLWRLPGQAPERKKRESVRTRGTHSRPVHSRSNDACHPPNPRASAAGRASPPRLLRIVHLCATALVGVARSCRPAPHIGYSGARNGHHTSSPNLT